MTKEKLHIPFPVIVEGKYDKIRLSNIMEGQIITTDGFGVFRQKEKRLLLRRLSEASPLILLTDSDGGGKVIRSHLTGMIPPDRLIQVYIPPVRGKERRKIAPSAAGLLGVEGCMTCCVPMRQRRDPLPPHVCKTTRCPKPTSSGTD